MPPPISARPTALDPQGTGAEPIADQWWWSIRHPEQGVTTADAQPDWYLPALHLPARALLRRRP